MKVVLNIATLGPIGHLPRCPGTFGSIPGIFAALALTYIPASLGLVFLLLFFVVSVWASGASARNLGTDDPKEVVIDEALGMTIALFHIPISPLPIILSFLLFRSLDILKPPPVRQFDRELKGGLGIVMDDVAAGIMANLILRLLLRC